MDLLLQIARRVEDAVKAYTSVRDDTDIGSWRKGLRKEMNRAIFTFKNVRDGNHSNSPPPLHPTLAALSIVLGENGDLSLITNHPDVSRHRYYSPTAVFADLSSLPPPTADRWWDDIVANSLQRQTPTEPAATEPVPPEFEPPSPPSPSPPSPSPVNPHTAAPSDATTPDAPAPDAPTSDSADPNLTPADPADLDTTPAETARLNQAGHVERPTRRYRIKILPPRREQTDEDVEMLAAEAPKQPRKRKTSEAVPPQKSSKRKTSASKPAASALDSDKAGSTLPRDFRFECERCISRRVTCEPNPTGPCKQCRSSKLGCSLMPKNQATGKANRQALTEDEIFKFRSEQYLKKFNENQAKKKGKQPVHHQEGRQREASGSGESPSATLAPLRELSLASGSSPADSPVPVPSSETSQTGEASSTSKKKTLPPVPYVEVPPLRRRRHPSPTAISQSSDDSKTLSAKILALESQLTEMKEEFGLWREEIEVRLSAAGV